MIRWEEPQRRAFLAALHDGSAYQETPFYLPPKIAGAAWLRPLEQPSFSTAFKFPLHDTEAFGTPLARPPVFGWFAPIDLPAFSVTVKTHLQAHLSQDPSPFYLPPKIAGVAWWNPFEQPAFTTALKAQLQDTEAFGAPLSRPPAFGWHRPVEPPLFPTRLRVELQPHLFEALTPDTLPPKVAVLAWRVELSQPAFSTALKVHLQDTEAGSLTIVGSPPPPPAVTMRWFPGTEHISRRQQDVSASTSPLRPLTAPLAGIFASFEQPMPRARQMPAGEASRGFSGPFVYGVAWAVPFEAPRARAVQAVQIESLRRPLSVAPWVQATEWPTPRSRSTQEGAVAWPIVLAAKTWPVQQAFEGRGHSRPIVQPDSTFFLRRTLPPVPVSGMAWFVSVEAPRHRSLVQTSMPSFIPFLGMAGALGPNPKEMLVAPASLRLLSSTDRRNLIVSPDASRLSASASTTTLAAPCGSRTLTVTED